MFNARWLVVDFAKQSETKPRLVPKLNFFPAVLAIATVLIDSKPDPSPKNGWIEDKNSALPSGFEPPTPALGKLCSIP